MSFTMIEQVPPEDVAVESAAAGSERAAGSGERDFLLTICEHIKTSGIRCGSPALRGEKLCYYHAKLHKTVPKNNIFLFLDNPGRRDNDPYYPFEFPCLEDPAAVQIAFMQLIYAVTQHKIEEWRARMVLSALHGAAANLRQMDAENKLLEAQLSPKEG
jgi:hypothetical protein